MMADQIIVCTICNTPFVWTAAEQREARPDRCPMCRRLAPPPGRQRGIVKWYSRAKGYGFITPATGAEIFLHKSGLRPDQSPLAGQLVEFAVSHGPRGVQADDVEILHASGTEPAP